MVYNKGYLKLASLFTETGQELSIYIFIYLFIYIYKTACPSVYESVKLVFIYRSQVGVRLPENVSVSGSSEPNYLA